MSDMSFAARVRKELAEHISKGKHCIKAELRGIYEGSRHTAPFSIFSEGLTIPEKSISLMQKAYGLDMVVEKTAHGTQVSLKTGGSKVYEDLMSAKTLERECCKRAYLRGWFLAAGTVTDPEGSYHLEMVAGDDETAGRLQDIIDFFGITAKITHRKGRSVLYIKEGQKVVDFLNIVGAHVALMEFENTRILKEMRGNINRQVNCETANINKTISASAKQIEDIELISSKIGLDGLSDSLREIAVLRLENPEISLKELGEMFDPPVGKSGVNHRMRRIGEMADDLRYGGRK